jgi:YVTN family beta-propeller protein
MAMRVLKLCGAMILIVLAASCGGNNTSAGVTIVFPINNPQGVQENGHQQFDANVSGVATTTVYWQVCLPAASLSVEPTNCTPIPNVTINGQNPTLTGFGTITQTGLYTAPSTIPQPNLFEVMAVSTAEPTAFAVTSVEITPSVEISILPTSASMQAGEHIQFTATVTGATNTSVSWSVSQNAGGDVNLGFVCPNPGAPQPCTAGEYFAPTPSPGTVTVTATSVANPAVSASASVSITSAVTPTFTSLSPTTVAEGSAQQDVYITGSSFFNTTNVQVNNVTIPSADVIFISSTLLRATIPGSYFQQPGLIPVNLVEQNGDVSSSGNLKIVPMRPAVVAVNPDTVTQTMSGANFSLTGGFFVPGRTVAEFDGGSATTSYVDSRHLSVSLPSCSSGPTCGLNVTGLHQIVVQNLDAADANVPVPSLTAKNIAVTPNPGSIATVPGAPIPVGASPSAVAIDYATGTALVANTGEGTVSVVNLATNTVNANKIAVGNSPTGIAVDDLISPPLALVVNSADQTVSTIDLSTMTVIGTPLSVSLTTATPVPLPFSVGINPYTHRAIVAYQNTDEATILDISSGTAVVVQQFFGNINSPFGTGQSPAVAVDPRLNWAVVTPGGSGIGDISIVDLGRNAIPGVDAGRTPQVVYSAIFSPTNKTLGVGLNTETHQLLFTDPSSTVLTSFSLLSQSVNDITFTLAGVTINNPDLVAASVNPLANIGIAVNDIAGTAIVVDLENGNVLQTVNGLGTMPVAVALDPASDEAVVANQGDGTVSIVSLGAVRTPQILESSPPTTLTSASPLTLTITGSGFTSTSVVRLDQVAVVTSTVPSSCTTGLPVNVCRQITATIPASMLGSARRFIVDVLNSDSTVSNVTDFTVIQQVIVGTTPVGVAVDTDRDLAIVTNSVDATVSLVALSPETPIFGGGTAGAVGTIGSPIPVEADPQGVAVLPRLGLAAVANNGSNNVTIVDDTGTVGPNTLGAICSGCQPVGVAVDGDTGVALVTYSAVVGAVNQGHVLQVGLAADTAGGSTPASNVDQFPTGIAADPTLDYAAVAASQTNAVNLVDLAANNFVSPPIFNFQEPAGVAFDPLNQVFLVANSLQSTVVLLDPYTSLTTSITAGVNPTSVDYDFQASSLLTANSLTNTISELDYDCPPGNVPNGCSNPQVRSLIAGGSSSGLIGPNSIAIDTLLDLAVVVDPDNNRILLIPIPH